MKLNVRLTVIEVQTYTSSCWRRGERLCVADGGPAGEAEFQSEVGVLYVVMVSNRERQWPPGEYAFEISEV